MILSVLVAVTIFLALAGVMGMQVAELANDIPRYQSTIRQKVDTLRRFTTEPLSGLIGTVGREVQKASKDDAEQAAPGDRNTAPLPVEVRQPNPSPLELAERIISPVLNPLATTAIILIVAVFIRCSRKTCVIGSYDCSAPGICTEQPSPWTMRRGA